MNERQFRKRTDEESRARMEARREDKERQRAQKRGKVVWHSPSMGTRNEGRNAHKRSKRPAKRMTTPNPVRPAYRVRMPFVRPLKVLTHAPRSRVGSTKPAHLRRAHNRMRDRLARA